MASSPAPSASTRGAVASRALAAIAGNYVLTAIAVGLLARILPLSTAEATVAATLPCFALFAVVAMAVFSARSAGRAWAWMGGAIAVLGAMLWLSIAIGGRL